MSSLRRTIGRLRRAVPSRPLYGLLRKEHRSPFRYESPWLYRHGFLSESRHLYDFDRYGVHDYVSDFEVFARSPRMTERLSDFAKNKLCFDLALRPAFAEALPPLLGLLAYGTLHRSPAPSLRELAGRHGDVVIKPIAGGGGSEVLIIRSAGDHAMVNGTRKDPEYLDHIQRRSDMRIVQGFVEQSPWAGTLYPETTNTIRVLTLHDPDANEVFPAMAVQRVGTSASYPLDSWSHGGLSSEIDLASGVLGKATPLPERGQLQWHSRHPETDAPIEGCVVPGWREIVEVVISMAEHIPLLYAGWDVIVRDGLPVVIEANAQPGLGVLQVHRPLLADPRVRRAYEHYGMVTRRRNRSPV